MEFYVQDLTGQFADLTGPFATSALVVIRPSHFPEQLCSERRDTSDVLILRPAHWPGGGALEASFPASKNASTTLAAHPVGSSRVALCACLGPHLNHARDQVSAALLPWLAFL